jgi:AraC family transcriptional regulator
MISLTQGKYLGLLEKSIEDDYVIAAITSYHESYLCSKIHYHENPHISFVLHGGCLEKRNHKEIERLAGKITFYHSGEYHQSTHIRDASRHINLELLPSFLNEYDIKEADLDDRAAKNLDIKFFLLGLYKELSARDNLSEISVHMLLLELIHHGTELKSKQNNYPWLRMVDELLQESWENPVSLDFLSATLNLHPVTISKQFHKYYHCTLGQYVRKIKIEKALTLIKSSDKSLTEIAYACGFADQSHFIRTFKKFTGLLPHVYRQL